MGAAPGPVGSEARLRAEQDLHAVVGYLKALRVLQAPVRTF